MAIELLVRLYDGPAGRTSGDIINVKTCPCTWGKGEGLPNYAHIRINNIAAADFSSYHKRHFTTEIDKQIYMARSRYRVNIDTLPVNIKNALFKNGFYEIPSPLTILTALAENNLVLINGI